MYSYDEGHQYWRGLLVSASYAIFRQPLTLFRDLQWGRFFRLSPPCPKLLRDLYEFVPVFCAEDIPVERYSDPDDCHDVLQWLKVSLSR
jgi:hypothetical protein